MVGGGLNCMHAGTEQLNLLCFAASAAAVWHPVLWLCIPHAAALFAACTPVW